MDTSALVADSQALVALLDATRFKPLVAMLVKNEEADSWRLWIAPPVRSKKEEFFLELSKLISRNREKLPSIDIGLVEFKKISDHTIEAFGRMFRFGGIGAAYLNSITVNRILLPEAIAIRIEL